MKTTTFFGTQSVRQASLILIVVSVFAKFTGFFRETVTAREFGITADYDLFLIVFIVPAVISNTVNYTISYALTPYYQKIFIEKGFVFARYFVTKIFLYGLIFFIGWSTISVVFRDFIVSFLVFTTSNSDHQLAVQLLSILMWLLPLYFAIAVLQTILQAEHFFFAPSIGPLIQNIVIISVLLFFGRVGVVSLAYAWCTGLFFWFFWLFFAFNYTRQRASVPFFTKLERTSNYLLAPFLISGFQIAFIEIWPQLYVFFDRISAQVFNLVDGSIAALGYASTLYTMVLSVFAMSIGRAVFPFLSAHVAKGNKEKQIELLVNGFRWMILVSFPIAGALYALADEIVLLVYQHGNFDASATVVTAGVLKIFCIGLPFDSISAILVGYFYSLRDYSSLIRIALFSVIVKVIAGICLTHFFGYSGLAASTIVAVVCKAVFMTIRLNKHNIPLDNILETRALLWKSLLSVLPGILIAFYLIPLLSPLMFSIVKIPMLANLLIIIVGSGMIFFFYGLMLTVVRIHEWLNFMNKVRSLLIFN